MKLRSQTTTARTNIVHHLKKYAVYFKPSAIGDSQKAEWKCRKEKSMWVRVCVCREKCTEREKKRDAFHTGLLTNEVVSIVAIECHPANNWTLIRSTGWFSNGDIKKVYMASVCCAKLLRTVTSYKDFSTTKRIYCAPVSAIFAVRACSSTWAFVFHMQGQLLRAHHKCKVFYPLESVASVVFGGCAWTNWKLPISSNSLFIALDQCIFPESDNMIFGQLNLSQCLWNFRARFVCVSIPLLM